MGNSHEGRSLQRGAQAKSSRLSGLPPRNDLRHHGIVKRRDAVTRLDPRIDAKPLPLGNIKPVNRSCTWQEARGGILGAEPDFNRVPKEIDVLLLRR